MVAAAALLLTLPLLLLELLLLLFQLLCLAAYRQSDASSCATRALHAPAPGECGSGGMSAGPIV